MAAQPGWYTEPATGAQRWWDGHQWGIYAVQYGPGRRRSSGPGVLVSIVVGVLVALMIIGAVVAVSGAKLTGDDHTVHVAYDVTGNGTSRASVTFTAASGTTQRQVKVPFHTEVDLTSSDILPQILAQNESDSGELTCSVTVDGKRQAHNTSSGGFTIVTCEGDSLIGH